MALNPRRGRPWLRFRYQACLRLITIALALTLAACSSAPYRYEPLEQFDITQRAQQQTSENFEVRAAVSGGEEAEALLGIDVASRNVQPVWVEITNRSDDRARIAISSIDPKYFPPAEVAYFFRKQFSKEGWMDLEKRLIDMALPRFVGPRETVSGFVFTNRTPGSKSFNLDLYHTSLPPTFEQFTFFLRVPGFEPDYAAVRFRELYSDDELVEVDQGALDQVLADFACCTTDIDGDQQGRPVNLFIVSEPLVLLRTLLRAGWLETQRTVAEAEPESAHYLLGRPADGTFRKPRDRETDRSELAIWKTPVVVDGRPMWAAQLRNSVGRRFEIGERLFGVRLDPDTTDGRDFVLQSFWYAQALEQWALSTSGSVVPEESPAKDFLGNPWFSPDPFRTVMWLSPTPVAMDEARQFYLGVDVDQGDAP